MRAITRFDYGKTHGWWVRFQRGVGSEKSVTSALFSDAKWSGKRKALDAAKKWRNRTEREVGKPVLPKPEVPPGYGYVRRADVKQRVRHTTCWVAWLRIEDKRCQSTKFSVETHGNQEARRRAEAWLEQKRRELRKRLGHPLPRLKVTPPPPPPPRAAKKRKKRKKVAAATPTVKRKKVAPRKKTATRGAAKRRKKSTKKRGRR